MKKTKAFKYFFIAVLINMGVLSTSFTQMYTFVYFRKLNQTKSLL